MSRRVLLILLLIVFGVLSAADAQKEKLSSDWPAYGRDAGGSRFSPLNQINRANVSRLKVAWIYRTGVEEVKAVGARNAAFEATPILVDGLLYLTTPYSRVIALDPATGAEKWSFDPQIPLNRWYSEMTSRGVSAWPAATDNKKTSRRIFVATLDARLIALDAATGKTIPSFGEKGQVDLKQDVRLGAYDGYQNYQVTSPPAIIGDLVVVGSAIGDNGGVEMERGVVRAFDAVNLGGSLVTAGGLVFIAATMDETLRAFDAESGTLIWEAQLPASAQAAPMTYSAGGKQFVVICAGGHGKLGTKRGDHVVAYALRQ